MAVVDKADGPGAHQTGHNSGVIHSGLYYKPGSQKARLCVDGARAMKRSAPSTASPTASTASSSSRSTSPSSTGWPSSSGGGLANGVEGMRRVDAAGIRAVEPHAGGVAGLHITSTGVADYVGVCRALDLVIADGGGAVSWGREVAHVGPVGDLGVVRFTDGRRCRRPS